MIGESRGSNQQHHHHQLNPNYDYDDSRNNIPMMDRDSTTSTGSVNIGMGDERRSPHHRNNYQREMMENEGE